MRIKVAGFTRRSWSESPPYTSQGHVHIYHHSDWHQALQIPFESISHARSENHFHRTYEQHI
jgi:hypothetical protein